MALETVDLTKLDSSVGTQYPKNSVSKAKMKEAERIRQLWVNSNSGKRQQWQAKEQRAYDFCLNSQLTQEEIDDLEASGMPTFIVNRMTPVIETMKFFVTANSPRWKAVGAEGSDVDLAQIHTDMIDYSWYISSGKSMFGMAIGDSLMKSKGYIHIYVDPDGDRGMGEVMFERVDPFDVWTSSMSNDFLERDATYHIIKKDLPRNVLINNLPDFEKEIKKASGEADSTAFSERDLEESDSIQPAEVEDALNEEGEKDDILNYYEVYEPTRVQYYNLYVVNRPSDAEIRETRGFVDEQINKLAEELDVQLVEGERALREKMARGEIVRERYNLEMQKMKEGAQRQLQEQEAILVAKAKEEATKVEQKFVTAEEYEKLKKLPNWIIQDAYPYFAKKVKKTCVVGDQFLYSTILNVSHVPLIPIPYTHTGTPYPMSAALPLVGKQQEINKSHQIMIHNANLSSNLRWKYVEGEIDEDLWERYSSSPGALLPYRPGMSDKGPIEIMPQPINNAFFTIEQDSKSDLEYMAGIQPPSMGISSANDETYRGFLAKDEYGTRRIRSWVSNIVEPALEHIGKIYMEMAQDTYTIHKVFRIVHPNPSGGQESRDVEINVPIYGDNGDVIGRYNDYASSRYDIRIIAGSTLPINRWAITEEYMKYLELGVIDDIAFIAETDIKNKDELLRRKSMLAQQQQQIQSMEEAIKDRDGTIETLQRQLVQAGIKGQIKDAEMEIDRSKTELKMADKLFQERIRDELKMTREAMKNEIEKLRAEIKAKAKAKDSKSSPKSS